MEVVLGKQQEQYRCSLKPSNKRWAGAARRKSAEDSSHKGFALLPQVRDRHANYNFMDYHTYKQQQDADLVLDLANLDI
jgi:hypothetical protein